MPGNEDDTLTGGDVTLNRPAGFDGQLDAGLVRFAEELDVAHDQTRRLAPQVRANGKI